MEHRAWERFEQIHTRAAEDPEYQQFRQRLDELDLPLLEVLEKLEPREQTVIRDYIRVLGSSALRLTEIACEII